jgi:hypothetical protein
MPGAGALRRLFAGVVVVAAAAVGTSGCVVAAYPEPFGPTVVVAPRPVIVAPRPHRGYYRGGYHRHWGGHRHWGHHRHWR